MRHMAKRAAAEEQKRICRALRGALAGGHPRGRSRQREARSHSYSGRASVGDVLDAEAEHAKHGRVCAQIGHQSKKTTWTRNQSSCALTSHTFTRSARREVTVVVVSPADHAQHVKERAVHENVKQGVMP